MRFRTILARVILMLVCGLMLPAWASAEVVGHITQVEGRVDLLKGGKLPAIPVALQDKVESRDVLRTKSLSKVQITFIDQSIINLSPGSRLAIDEYQVEPALGKRRAMLSLFRGLAHVVVNKLFKVEEPDFIIKSHTAVTGVRGTDFGIRLSPNSSTILNFSGATRVGNIFPEVHAWERRAPKIAFQPPGGGSFFVPGGFVDLQDMQGTTVQSNSPPTLPFGLTSQDRQQFMNQMVAGTPGQQSSGNPGAGPGGAPTSSTSVAATADLGLTSGSGDTAVTILNIVTVPPSVVQPPTQPPTPTPSTFNFTQQYYGAWILVADAPYTQGTLQAYSWGQRIGVYDGYFSSGTEATRTASAGVTYAALSTGTSTGSADGTVTGFLGQTLTGTMNFTGTDVFSNIVNRTGTITILPTGELTYNWTDTVTNGGVIKSTGTGTSTQTPGTHFTQDASGSATNTANLAGNQVTSTNSGDMVGTRTMAGGVPSPFRSGFSVTATAPNAGTFSSSGSYSTSETSQGVLGPPDANGVRTGVMTNNVTTPSGVHVSGGPVRFVPATSSTPEAMFAQRIRGFADTNSTSIGMSAQTPDASALIGTHTYEGSGNMTSTSPYTTGTFSSSGWGLVNGNSEIAYTATMNLTATRTTGGTFDSSSSDILRHTSAAVVIPDGYGTYHGPVQGIGIAGSGENTVISTTGTVTGNPLTASATTNFNGTWVESGGKGTITAGTQTMTPGTYFTQTTTTGGSVTFGTPQGTGPYTQDATHAATMTRTGVAPGTQVLTPSSVITSSTINTSGAFPASGTVPTNINIQGVVASSSGGSGNMTMTTHPTVGTPVVSTYRGPVTITTPYALNGDVVGKNHAHPGVNRVPATQTGVVASAPVF